LGGGFVGTTDGELHETIFRLPLDSPQSREGWFNREFLNPNGHPVFRSGLRVNAELQPVDEEGRLLYENLFITGSSLAGSDTLVERSFDGVALATGYAIGKKI
jgi:glycerol-3-phosphate dehydrogenase subunit B